MDFIKFRLNSTCALKLTFPFPNLPLESKLAEIQKKLPMGWTESPPVFSVATETIFDLINVDLESSNVMPQTHPLETLASTPDILEMYEPHPYPIKETGPITPPGLCGCVCRRFYQGLSGMVQCIEGPTIHLPQYRCYSLT